MSTPEISTPSNLPEIGIAAPVSERSWADALADIWSRPETKEVVGVVAGAAALGIGLRYGGPILSRAFSLLERVAPEIVENPESFVSGDVRNAHMMIANDNNVAIELIDTMPKPAVLRTDRSQIGSVLDNPDRVVELADKLHGQAKLWPDLLPARIKTEALEERAQAASQMAATKISQKGWNFTLDSMSTPQLEALKTFPGIEGTSRWLQTAIARRTEYQTSIKAINSELINNTRAWTTDLNGFARSHGIPSARLQLQHFDGCYGQYSDRVISVEPQLVIDKSKREWATQIGIHEFTHHEQDFLRVNRMADLIGVGKKASVDQISEIGNGITNSLSPKNIARYLDIRNGRPLAAGVEARADALLESNSTLRSLRHPQDIARNQFWYDQFEYGHPQDNLRALFGPDGDKIASALAADAPGSPAVQKVFADFSRPYSRVDKIWSEQYTRNVRESLNEYIRRGRQLMQDSQRKYDHAYGSSFHEQEAFGNGTIALQHLLKS